jgi:tetratricopeptide (TPR) repeat protein
LGTLGGTRSALWHVALQAFEQHPLGGTGAGTFEFVWNRNPDRTSFVRDAHSLYLESLGELGLPGTLLVLILLGTLLVAAFRTTVRAPDAVATGAGAGITAALVVFCVCAGVDWLWESTAVTAMALALGTLAATAGARSAPPVGIVRRLPVAVLMLLALAVQLPVLTAAVQVRASQHAVRAGDMDRAVVAANTAVQSAPWEASGYLQRALVLEELGLWRRATMDARRAVDREPTNWQNWLILARLEAEDGHASAAVAHVRRAADLNPRAAMFTSQARSAPGPPRTP